MMCEELNLFEFDNVRELKNDFLRVLAKLCTLPPTTLRAVVQQFSHWIVRILSYFKEL